MAKFQTAPNQKVVRVNKAPTDGEHLYAKINIEAMSQAARTLDFKTFELWIYFAKNRDIHTFALSNVAVLNEFGMKKDSYDAAIKQLIDNRYLVQEDRMYYSFNEFPVPEIEPEPEPELNEFERTWGSFIKVGNTHI